MWVFFTSTFYNASTHRYLSPNMPSHFYQNGGKIWHTSPKERANCLNSYFAEISAVNDSKAVLPQCQYKTFNKLNINEITISEIKDAIHSLDINKASGPDNISHRMLKGCIGSI